MSTGRPRLASRAYDLILRCYPKAFREEYGRDMRAAFLAQWRMEERRAQEVRVERGRAGQARGWLRLARVATSVVADTGWTAGKEHLHVLHQDLRVTWRALRKAPAFTFAAVATLALGIGATTAMFSIVHAVLLRPLPVADPVGLVELVETMPREGILDYSVSEKNFLSWRERARSFAGIAALRAQSFTLADAGDAERVDGMRVSANLWALLGVQPLAGRLFDQDADAAGGAQVVIVGEGLWRRRYASSHALVGQAIRLNGTPHTVVGIVPSDVGFTSSSDLFVPYALDQGSSRGDRQSLVVGRLRPGVGVAQASAELEGVAAALAREFPKTNESYRARVRPLLDMVVPEHVDRALKVLLAAVALLLLVACANVANLVLTRATARAPELALRRALGAGGVRLTRQALTENLVLAAMGGAAGVALAAAGLQVARVTLAASLPRVDQVSLDGLVLAFAAAVTMLTGITVGLIPIWRVLRTDVIDALRPASRVVSDRSQTTLRHAFVVGQFGLATMLAIGAALLAQSLSRLMKVDMGFPGEQVLVASIYPSPDKYPTPDHVQAFFGEVSEALRVLPGVAAVGLTSNAPGGPVRTGMEVGPTQPTAGSPEGMRANWRVVSPEYFRALDVPLRRGRLFAEREPAALRSIILSDAVVRRLWPDGSDPIGRRVWMGNGQVRTIVGVVGDVHLGDLHEGLTPVMYLPTSFFATRTMAVVVRTEGEHGGEHGRQGGGPAALAVPLRQAVRRIDPQQAVFRVQTLEAQMRATAAASRVNATIAGLFAALALALGAVGVAGVVAHGVTRRRAELAVRMALGATGRRVMREVAVRGLTLCASGLVLGLAGASAVGRVLSALLFGVDAHDPMLFGSVALALLVVAAVACWVPASRVTRIDPATALRGE